jgi:hypothetical protein
MRSFAHWRIRPGKGIKVRVDIYGHLALGGNKEAVNGLDDDATISNLSATKNEKELTSCG